LIKCFDWLAAEFLKANERKYAETQYPHIKITPLPSLAIYNFHPGTNMIAL